MADEAATQVTSLLQAIGAGDESARGRLFELLYDELRGVARRQLHGRSPNASLQPTALVNEACLRLLQEKGAAWDNRRHFFFAAARAMRNVLVDGARRRLARRRGGDWKQRPLEELDLAADAPTEDVLVLDDALTKLEAVDARQADIVRLRFFAGLGDEEIADALGISKRTVTRDWGLARARLALLVRPPPA